MAWSPLLGGPRAGGVGLLVLLLFGLLRPPPAFCARPVKSARPGSAGLGVRVCGARLAATPCPPLAPGAGPASPRRSPVALSTGLARMKEGGARTGLCPRGDDWGAPVRPQLLRAWSTPRTNDPALGLEDDPDAPAAQLARALLRARLDPAALAAQLVPGPAPAAALRPRPPVYDDGPTGPEAEDAGDETPDVDPELLRYLLGRILAGSADPEAVAVPRRLRRAADQDLGPEVPPEGVLGALLRVKRLETPSPQAPVRRLLPP
ncbi:PREDICTED: proSAAS [Odobenus rosmarus divergens]|uniref:ProSAAS n=1 Tax=Odobenus rosmarus divergens TaxID=9708 RepID=A0A2U3VP63_ODORO|nr:PREDICTED: proSAAS [Odobenus rosmarus divergens]